MQDQLDVSGILAPGVERSYRALVRGEVTLGVPPFFYQSVSPSATYSLCQSNHHFLAGGCLGDPTNDPLDSIHPDLELHVGSEATGPVVVCWP